MKRTLENMDYDKDVEELARFAKALAHPTRITILKYMDSKSCCFTGGLVEVLPLSQSTISQHLKELKDAGLIKGELNPPKIKYCINQENWSKMKLLFKNILK